DVYKRQALSLWQEWQPHLILMDMQMPVMDGYEAAREIRRQEEQRRRERAGEAENDSSPILHPSSFISPKTPIIALTASAFESQRPSILAAGCDDLIVKPFSENDLLEKIAAHLGVRYRYEMIPELPPAIALAASTPLTPADLQQLPVEERSQLHQLALCARGRQLRERIEEFPEDFTDLGRSLLYLVDNLHFERIIELTELAGIEAETDSDR
ncbi:MAG: response regulator, partial [Spirulina sp.]